MICTTKRKSEPSVKKNTAIVKRFRISNRAAWTAFRESTMATADAIEIGATIQNTIQSPTLPALLGAGRSAGGRRWLQELPLLEDRLLASLERHLVVAGERERSRWACLDAEAAHDATQVVDLVDGRVSLARRHPVGRGVVGPLDVDRVGGAGPRAELAPDALLQAVLMAVQQVPADVGTGRKICDLLRVLGRHVLAE